MYQVGQVLYVILKKRQKIIPVQVIEQIVRRTADGEKVQYLVNVPTRPDTIDLDTLGEQVFEDINSVKKTLRKNIFNVIDDMADKAISIAIEHFGLDKVHASNSRNDTYLEGTPPEVLATDPSDVSSPTDIIKIQLDNGQLANVKMPDVSIHDTNTRIGVQKKR